MEFSESLQWFTPGVPCPLKCNPIAAGLVGIKQAYKCGSEVISLDWTSFRWRLCGYRQDNTY